jgi:hypothetical protein
MVTPVVWPSRHQRLLPLGWPIDGASCQASANYAREYLKSITSLGQKRMPKFDIFSATSFGSLLLPSFSGKQHFIVHLVA